MPDSGFERYPLAVLPLLENSTIVPVISSSFATAAFGSLPILPFFGLDGVGSRWGRSNSYAHHAAN